MWICKQYEGFSVPVESVYSNGTVKTDLIPFDTFWVIEDSETGQAILDENGNVVEFKDRLSAVLECANIIARRA